MSNNVAPGVTRTDAAGNDTPSLPGRNIYANDADRGALGRRVALLVR